MFQITKILLILSAISAVYSQNLYDDVDNVDTYEYDDVTGDEGGYDDEEYVTTSSQIPPHFTSKEQNFSVEIGGDITFPCHLENQGQHVLMFKHVQTDGEHRLLFVGDMSLKQNPKLEKEGNTFKLTGVRRKHAGKYICRIETNPAIEVIHTLDVEYPAKVRRVSPEIQQVVQGSSVSLECAAEGNPQPAITWTKQKGQLPSGAKTEEGLSMLFENVDRHVEGSYTCTASNGLGRPSYAHMSIKVKYPPEIITEEAIMHTGEGDEAKLVCIVHGRPSPRVIWSRRGHHIKSDQHITTHDYLHRHTLTIKQVKEEDFGDYICTAESPLGRTNSTLRLTGLPKPPRLTSSPAGGEKKSYTLTWETDSHTPVIMYRLQYRKKEETTKQTTNTTPRWNIKLHSAHKAKTAPTQHSSGSNIPMSHAITDLEPATDYEAKVAVENKFGWSGDSEIFHFYTRKEVAVGQSSRGVKNVVLIWSLISPLLPLLLLLPHPLHLVS